MKPTKFIGGSFAFVVLITLTPFVALYGAAVTFGACCWKWPQQAFKSCYLSE